MKLKFVFRRHLAISCVVCTIAFCGSVYPQKQRSQRQRLDAPFVPSMEVIVDAMLRLADVSRDDVVYDLGCGDGRIVIAAAQKFGARGVGVDIDPERIKEARQNARNARVAHRVKFIRQDLFKSNINNATVVMLYLRPDVNLRLRPKLLKELKPGTRVVSNSFDMGDWKPDKIESVAGNPVYFWTIPAKAPVHR